jgi:hypothetical protein
LGKIYFLSQKRVSSDLLLQEICGKSVQMSVAVHCKPHKGLCWTQRSQYHSRAPRQNCLGKNIQPINVQRINVRRTNIQRTRVRGRNGSGMKSRQEMSTEEITKYASVTHIVLGVYGICSAVPIHLVEELIHFFEMWDLIVYLQVRPYFAPLSSDSELDSSMPPESIVQIGFREQLR